MPGIEGDPNRPLPGEYGSGTNTGSTGGTGGSTGTTAGGTGTVKVDGGVFSDSIRKAEVTHVGNSGFTVTVSSGETFTFSFPDLPKGDQSKFGDWAATFTQHGIAGNPYMSPSILAIVAPILSDISKIMNEIVMQSGKLSVQSMELITQSAMQAFDCAIQAGEARGEQLKLEAKMHVAAAVISFVNAGIQFASMVKMGNEINTKKTEIENNYRDEYSNALPAKGTPEKLKMDKEIQEMQHETTSKYQMQSSIVTSLTGGIKESIDANMTFDKAEQSEIESSRQAMAQLLDKLIQMFSETLQKAGASASEASNFSRQMADMVKSFAETAAQMNARG